MEKYILVVEDDYKSQQLLQQFLTSNGYKVDCANDVWKEYRCIKTEITI